jgi:Tol biopolymer transport system component
VRERASMMLRSASRPRRARRRVDVFGKGAPMLASSRREGVPPLVLASLVLFSANVATAAPQRTTVEASVSTSGAQANADSHIVDVSRDGNYVVFESVATNLDPLDTNSRIDVYWHSLLTGETRVVCKSSSGVLGNKVSQKPRVSSDGAFVVFQSDATNLVSGDNNATTDVFVHELATGITTRASVSGSGVEGNNFSLHGRLSDDGLLVLYASDASNLVSGDANKTRDIFLYDRVAGTVERLNVSTKGKEANGFTDNPMMSSDSNVVVFQSNATTLDKPDTNNLVDVFVRDRAAGTTKRVSLAWDGSEGNGESRNPAVSADGKWVAFESWADNLVPNDTNRFGDVFVVEVATGTIERVDLDSNGLEIAGGSAPSLSEDGRYVSFLASANDIVDGDDNGVTDVFVRDRWLGLTSRVSLGDHDQPGTSQSDEAVISSDGTRVAFASNSPGFVPADVDTFYDVFVRTRDLTPASWLNYGSGLAGTRGVPQLTASALPQLNTTFDLLVDGSGRWYTVGLLAIGDARASVPAWGGTLLVDPVICTAIVLAPGTNAIPEDVPPEELLAADVVDLQVLQVDPGAAGGVSFTPGLELTLGF